MKTKIVFFLLFSCFGAGLAQTDTLYTRKNQKIPCKIFEINEYEIKYGMVDGPMIVIDKSQVIKYRLSNGYTEILTRDELLVDNEHQEIIKSRAVIKIHPFSLINNQVSLAFEKVIKVGMNMDVEAGYINSEMNQYSLFGNNNNFSYGASRPTSTGAYVKPGLKFFLGQDYSVKGLKYAHPLKGRYIKLDLAFSYLNYKNITSQYGYQYYPPQQQMTISTDITSIAFGGFVNYGRQFILGNLLTMEYYIGVGYTGQNNNYSNPAYLSTVNPYYGSINEATSISNYHGFMRIPLVGLSGTAGFRIGYILPEKTTRKAE